MSDQNLRGGKRMRKAPTAEAKSKIGKQEAPTAQPKTFNVKLESEADRLLRKIFFRSGPLPMAPDEGPGK